MCCLNRIMVDISMNGDNEVVLRFELNCAIHMWLLLPFSMPIIFVCHLICFCRMYTIDSFFIYLGDFKCTKQFCHVVGCTSSPCLQGHEALYNP